MSQNKEKIVIASLYIKKVYLKGGGYHSLPMAETEEGKHYPCITPVPLSCMLIPQEGKIIKKDGNKYFSLSLPKS